MTNNLNGASSEAGEKLEPTRLVKPNKMAREVLSKMKDMDANGKISFLSECLMAYANSSKKNTRAFFKFCVALSEVAEVTPAKERKSLYENCNFKSVRTAQKRIVVGKKLRHYESVHLDVFSPSQLIRIAEIGRDDVMDLIILNQIKLSSASLDKLNTNFGAILGNEEDREQIEIKIRSFFEVHDEGLDPDEDSNEGTHEPEKTSGEENDVEDKSSGKPSSSPLLRDSNFALAQSKVVEAKSKAILETVDSVGGNVPDIKNLAENITALKITGKSISAACESVLKKIEKFRSSRREVGDVR